MTSTRKPQTLKRDSEFQSPIRVLHLIDSLALGGAERMAVNLCNALAEAGCEMHLCATRKSGPMQTFIRPEVRFFELKKKSTLDVSAILRLREYIGQNGIQIIHAHATSFFVGCLTKWMTGVRLVWHDHYGDSELLAERKAAVLRLMSRSFDSVLSVNEALRQWAVGHLHVPSKRISYLQNFPSLDGSIPIQTTLPGQQDRRIVCTARLHRQKDHQTLIRAMALVHRTEPDAHLLLVGQDLQDAYSNDLKGLITELQLDHNVHLLGGRTDIAAILNVCSIGVLSSESEGLPVSLLEYGLAGLAVVCTDVGECATVLGQGRFGKVVSPKDPEMLANTLKELLGNTEESRALGERFKGHVLANYSGKTVALKTYELYTTLLQEA